LQPTRTAASSWQRNLPEQIRQAMIGQGVTEDVSDRLLGYLANRVQQPGRSSHRASGEHLGRTFGLQRKRRCVIHGVLTSLDHGLTLTRTQYSAIVGNRGNKRPLTYGGIHNLVQRSAAPDRSLVMRLGQRFESARRLYFPAYPSGYSE